MNELREYKINGTLIIGIDHGYGNIKTARRVFPTSVIKADEAPAISSEYIEYNGSFYINPLAKQLKEENDKSKKLQKEREQQRATESQRTSQKKKVNVYSR